MKIAISPGHGTRIRGASGPEPWGLDEVDYCQMIVPIIARHARALGAQVEEIVDEHSTSQQQNLNWLVDQHNDAFDNDHGDDRLDVSVHLNAYEVTTTTARGSEVWYYSQKDLAEQVSADIAAATALPDRGEKYSDDLMFLTGCASKAILIEVGFCDAKPDCDALRMRMEEIAESIAATICGVETERPPVPPPVEGGEVLFTARGTCSWFGGPEDDGVAEDEGLAFIYDVAEADHLFLPEQPPGTTGLARRLDAERAFYIACRWDYQVTPKGLLADQRYKAKVTANNKSFYAYPADWGPHSDTGRVADLSPALCRALGVETDDIVEVVYPA
jgi:hypothetical protein